MASIKYRNSQGEYVILQNNISGPQGQAGNDGISPTVSTTSITDGTRITITDANGDHSFNVMNGAQGIQGPAGSSAWSDITGKPSTFTPSSHTHTKSQITDFPTIPTVTTYTATIPSTSWTGSAAPYYKDVTVTGITASDTPIIDIVQTGTAATDDAMREDWGKITRITTSANKIRVYADEKPSASIPIQLKVVR